MFKTEKGKFFLFLALLMATTYLSADGFSDDMTTLANQDAKGWTSVASTWLHAGLMLAPPLAMLAVFVKGMFNLNKEKAQMQSGEDDTPMSKLLMKAFAVPFMLAIGVLFAVGVIGKLLFDVDTFGDAYSAIYAPFKNLTALK